ncbi:hypothetical protein L198_07158 [Cryptococcus wingfieldii CBS 7118]|uniref:Uncharacterized protein n=1 Tax=Cryptococcus wingfieldii CBS 7118 TaxID=1295528 RepID=A0A1E3IFV3_9TREE|nr:hypothetical protein L198_07158 [Cryptococcus wingfieldii CBS 7118]ODN86796.1 hypothetical protein L198_07158 [Cryptococcus wingfieldii CBS 7118]
MAPTLPFLNKAPQGSLSAPSTSLMVKADLVTQEEMSRLTDFYPYAFTDFFGSGTRGEESYIVTLEVIGAM